MEEGESIVEWWRCEELSGRAVLASEPQEEGRKDRDYFGRRSITGRRTGVERKSDQTSGLKVGDGEARYCEENGSLEKAVNGGVEALLLELQTPRVRLAGFSGLALGSSHSRPNSAYLKFLRDVMPPPCSIQ